MLLIDGITKQTKDQRECGDVMNSRKQAWLIMAHTNFDQLKVLLSVLDDQDNDIYVHINKKSKSPTADELSQDLKYSKLILLENRFAVDWGDNVGLDIQMALLERAMSNDHYWYYHFISGMDLPIKNKEYIKEFLIKNEYVCSTEHRTNYIEIQKCPAILEPRVRHYNFGKTHWQDRNKLSLLFFRGGNKLLRYVQWLLRIDRFNKWNMELYQGSTWWSISDEVARFYVNNKDKIKTIFDKWTFAADEFAIQTVVGNSEFAGSVFKPTDANTSQNFRLIDFKRGNGLGSPHVFTKDDEAILLNSGNMLARKFNELIDPEIIETIVDRIHRKQ